MEKYYTPTIDEFHIGFEYECQIGYYSPVTNIYDEGWISVKVESNNPLNWIEAQIKDNLIRVKYLDKEDIESLGFKIVWEEHKPYGDYYKGSLGDTDIWYAKLTNKIPYIVLTTKYYNGNTRANIKNKSELKKILKQTGTI